MSRIFMATKNTKKQKQNGIYSFCSSVFFMAIKNIFCSFVFFVAKKEVGILK